MRAVSLRVVELLHVHHLLLIGHHLDRYVVVATVLEHYQPAVHAAHDQIQGQVAVGHGHDRVGGIGIAAAHQVAETLVDSVDLLPTIELGRAGRQLLRYQVADAAQLLVAIGVGGFALEDHLAAREHRAFRNQQDGVLRRVAVPVRRQQFRQQLHVELDLGDDAAVGRAGHGRQHGREPGIAAEDLQHQEALVRAGRRAQRVGQRDGARDAGAEADAVVGARHVVVHGFGNAHHLEALFGQMHAVAQRVVAADGDQVIDAQPLQVLEHLRGHVVDFVGVFLFQVRRHFRCFHRAGAGARGVQERAARAPGPVDDLFAQVDVILVVVVIFLSHRFGDALPAAAQANDLVALAQRANRYRTDCRVESGHIAASGQDADGASVVGCHSNSSEQCIIACGWRTQTRAGRNRNLTSIRRYRQLDGLDAFFPREDSTA